MADNDLALIRFVNTRLMIAGAMDHWLLVKVVQGLASAASSAEHVDTL